jgi:hypothetical protein
LIHLHTEERTQLRGPRKQEGKPDTQDKKDKTMAREVEKRWRPPQKCRGVDDELTVRQKIGGMGFLGLLFLTAGR